MQICASQDDLFALDERGDIYRYNFNTKTWMTLNPQLDATLTSRWNQEEDDR